MEQTVDETSDVIIRVFGGLGVDRGDAPVSIGGPRQRRLLALLAIHPHRVVTVDALAENLWTDGDRPEATGPAIRTYVSRLRSSGTASCLETSR